MANSLQTDEESLWIMELIEYNRRDTWKHCTFTLINRFRSSAENTTQEDLQRVPLGECVSQEAGAQPKP